MVPRWCTARTTPTLEPVLVLCRVLVDRPVTAVATELPPCKVTVFGRSSPCGGCKEGLRWVRKFPCVVSTWNHNLTFSMCPCASIICTDITGSILHSMLVRYGWRTFRGPTRLSSRCQCCSWCSSSSPLWSHGESDVSRSRQCAQHHYEIRFL